VSPIVAAQETTSTATAAALNLDENIQAQDLDVGEPRILPDSPFYFLKNWVRGIQDLVTINPVKKAELRMKFANEKLMEVKKIVQKTEDPEIIKKATENYQQEAEKIKNQVEKIKEKARENPQVESFLDKFTHQQILHEKLLERLETQVPSQAFEKIKEAREEHLEMFKDVMLKLEDQEEKITEKLDKVLEEQKGSQFKEFKNLEVLKNLEEKVPEEAKEAIQRAQENALKRLQGDLEKMPLEDQEKFGEYLEKISGEKEKQLEILENLKAKIKEAFPTPETTQLKEKLEEGKTKILEKIEQKLEKLDCPLWTSPATGFCKEGRIIVEKDPETDCPLPPKCIIPGETREIITPKPSEPSEMKETIPTCETDEDCVIACAPCPPPPAYCPPCPTGKCIEGKCAEIYPTTLCITLWDPVCGKDGKTYSNECFAKLAGVEVAYKGGCEEAKE